MNVAQIILQQLGGNKFQVTTGAKNFVSHGNGNALSFKLPSRFANDGINYVKITLEPNDTYTMEFGKVWGTKYKVIKTVDQVYADMLRDIFANTTGLETSLGTMSA